MMKVKVFTGKSYKIEEQINEWLEANKIVIKHVKQSESMTEVEPGVTISVWYETE
jgi:hypothetical protein